MRLLNFFHQAVVLTLALPVAACGGSTGSEVGDSGPGDSPGPDATKLPTTPCNWSAGTRSSCDWTLEFHGDPTTCAGFSGQGTAAQCLTVCGYSDQNTAPISCTEYSIDDAGTNTVDCFACTLNGGRRPAYFASLGFGAPLPGREVGSHFARAACLEAAAVDAFRCLRDELIAHGAPRRLVRAASRAVRDERRHVRVTSALARRFGEEPIAPRRAPPRSVRSLLEIALENAVEGCVRETYSALECLWQAHVAADPVVRSEMTRIARDEMRHLALSWEVHAWAGGRLDAASRARVRRAQESAVADLLAEVAGDPHASLVHAAGLPLGAQSRALIESIASRLAA
jgi:hypothetical protein